MKPKLKPADPDAADWRAKIRGSMGTRVNRLMLIESGDDDKAALDAIKVLLELSGELKDDPASKAPVAPLFALPTNTEPTLTPRKDTH